MTAQVDTPAAGKARHAWMDVARGLAIVLVLMLHSVSYFKSKGGIVPEFATYAVNFFAPVRMPTLYFLSGMLLNASLQKGLAVYTYGKLRNLVWPYLLWVVLWAAATGTLGDLGQGKTWLGGWYLWFMYFLMVYFLVAIFTARINHFVVAAFAFVLSLMMEDGTKYAERLYFFMSIFFVGAFVGGNIKAFEAVLRKTAPLLLVPLLVGIMVYSAIKGPVRYSPDDAILIMICVLAACALTIRIAGERVKAVFAFIGVNSIVFYVVHMPLIAMIVLAAKAHGVTSFYAVAGASVLCAATVPLALIHLRQRFAPVGWLFAFPDLVDFKTGKVAGRLRASLDRTRILPSPADNKSAVGLSSPASA